MDGENNSIYQNIDPIYQKLAEKEEPSNQPLYDAAPQSDQGIVNATTIDELFLGQASSINNFSDLVRQIAESKKAVEKSDSDVKNVGFFRSFIDKLFGLGSVKKLSDTLAEAQSNLNLSEENFFGEFKKNSKSFLNNKEATEAFAKMADSKLLLKLVKSENFAFQENQQAELQIIKLATSNIAKIKSAESEDVKKENLLQVFNALHDKASASVSSEKLRAEIDAIFTPFASKDSGFAKKSTALSPVVSLDAGLSASSSTDEPSVSNSPNLARRPLPPLPSAQSAQNSSNSEYATMEELQKPANSEYVTMERLKASTKPAKQNVYDDLWNSTSFSQGNQSPQQENIYAQPNTGIYEEVADPKTQTNSAESAANAANKGPIYSAPNKSWSNIKFSVADIAEMAGDKTVHSEKSGNSYYYVNATIDQQDRVLVVKAKEGKLIGVAFRENVAAIGENGKWQLTAGAPFESPVMLNRVSSLQPWPQDLSATKPSSKEPSNSAEHPQFERLMSEEQFKQMSSGSRGIG